MDVEPLAISAVPHTRLLGLAAPRATLAINVLREPDIRDARSVLSNQMNMRIEDSGVHRLVVLTQQVLKVKLVEVHSLHQVAQSFRLKRGQTRVTDSCICLKVSIVDGLDQLLCDLDNLLLTSFHILFFIGVAALRGALWPIDGVVHNCSLWLLDSICLFVE